MTSQNPSHFLFSLPHSKTPSSDAKVHIRRIYDILQLCIQRGDLSRARRAWIILARCKEVNWRALWRMAICVLDDSSVREGNGQPSLSAIKWLRSMMLQYPNEQESILRELTLRLITAERYREALDQLDLYLPTFPYTENPVLHIYAGLLCLYMAQPSQSAEGTSDDTYNPALLRDAQLHLERVKSMDSENEIAEVFLLKIPQLSMLRTSNTREHESDEDTTISDDYDRQHKRLRQSVS